MQPGRLGCPRRLKREFWRLIATGMQSDAASRTLGLTRTTGIRWFGEAGGVPPIDLAEPSARFCRRSDWRSLLALHEHGADERAEDGGLFLPQARLTPPAAPKRAQDGLLQVDYGYASALSRCREGHICDRPESGRPCSATATFLLIARAGLGVVEEQAPCVRFRVRHHVAELGDYVTGHSHDPDLLGRGRACAWREVRSAGTQCGPPGGELRLNPIDLREVSRSGYDPTRHRLARHDP